MPVSKKPKHEEKPQRSKPVKEFTYRLTRLSVWNNAKNGKKPHYGFTIKRSYKAGEEWRKTNSLGYYELKDLQKHIIPEVTAWMEAQQG